MDTKPWCNSCWTIANTFYKASMLDFVAQRKHYAVAKLMIAKGNGSPDKQLQAVADQPDLIEAVLQKGKPSHFGQYL